MLWNANELAKISGDFENKLFMTKRRKSETEFPYLMKLLCLLSLLTLPAGAIKTESFLQM